MDGRAAREEEEHVLMTQEEYKKLKYDMTVGILYQWVDDGMTPEEAKTLFREMEQYGE